MATMPVMVKIGDRLKELRMERALTQQELGERAGIGKNTVNRLEQDKTDPRPSTLRKLAASLEVSPTELVRGG